MLTDLAPTDKSRAERAPTEQVPAERAPAERPGGQHLPAPGNRSRVLRRLREDAGAATAEYLVATMAAVGFAGLLIVILRGNEVRGILTELVRNALSVG